MVATSNLSIITSICMDVYNSHPLKFKGIAYTLSWDNI